MLNVRKILGLQPNASLKVYFGIPETFKLACVRQSKAAHDLYKKIAIPFHGLYFAANAIEGSGIVAYLSMGLLILLVGAWVVEEHMP